MVKREKSNYMIQSVCHALEVLEELGKDENEVGVTELSKRLKLHKNNVFRVLATLQMKSFVEQNRDSEDYRLGTKVLQLGQAYQMQNKLYLRAYPLLKSLSESIGETASFAVLQNGQVQFPISIESRKPVKVAARLATSLPAKSISVGRLLIAQLPDGLLSEYLSGNSPQDAAIRNQLTELRNTGLSIDRGGSEPEVVSISKVVRGFGNEVLGAIEVLIPQFRAKVETTLAQVEEASNTLSAALGAFKTPLAAALEKEVTTNLAHAGGVSSHASQTTASQTSTPQSLRRQE